MNNIFNNTLQKGLTKLNKNINMKNNTVLGMHLSDLSLQDICEEITDLRMDLATIEDFEKGYIGYSEMRQETMFLPSQKLTIIEGIDTLKKEKQRRF